MLRGTSTWSPGSSAWNTAAEAACPEEKSIAAFACSSDAISASAWS